MLTYNALFEQLRPLVHPMLVHFPIALLFASVMLDWLGYWLKHPNLTRAGFYTLVLGALGAGVAALSGPDHATGDPSVPGLLAVHQNFATLTVAVAVGLFAWRFLAARGVFGGWALLYLVFTLALLVSVSLAGYYGGEMTYHHAVGVTSSSSAVAGDAGEGFSSVRPLVPTKPFVALLGFVCMVGIIVWLTVGRAMVGAYYDTWWRAVHQELANANAPLWTLYRRHPATDSARPHPAQPYAMDQTPSPLR